MKVVNLSKRLGFNFACFFSLLVSSGAAVVSVAAVETAGSDCSHSDLINHQCHFEIDKDLVDVNSSSIKIAHGGRFSMTQHPLPGKDTTWEEAKVFKLADRSFLELLIWDMPYGLTETQSLRWITFEIVKGRLHKLGDEVVQERSRNTESSDVQEFVANERDDFGLSADKGHVLWRHGDKKRIIK